jgi:glycosyltransferase involved in cell wall biosynthesis
MQPSNCLATPYPSDAANGASALLMVVYNHVPDAESIDFALPHVDYVVLIDNSTDETVSNALVQLVARRRGQCILIPSKGNQGLSRAYNLAADYVGKLGVIWIHLLDHDAIFRGDYFLRSREAWESLNGSKVRVGAVVPIVSDDLTLLNRRIGLRRSLTTLSSAITSGILTQVGVLKEVGGFDESLFVEAADFELTSRMRRLGWSVWCINEVLVVQEFETPVVGRTLPVSLGSWATRFRSLVRVAIGNANIYRTRLSSYNPRRTGELRATLRRLRKVKGLRRQVAIIRALNRIEASYVRIFCQPLNGRAPVAEN